MSKPSVVTPTILIVDDDQEILTSLEETLKREEHAVVTCQSPVQALALLAERPFAVVIADHDMKEMPGLEFFIECRRQAPKASRVLMTAVLSLRTVIEATNSGEIFRFVAKPWLREELLATVRNALQHHELEAYNEVLQASTQRLNAQLVTANAELERQIFTLREEREKLDAANAALTQRFDNSLELCRRILTAYDPVLGGQSKVIVELANTMATNGGFSPEDAHALRSAAWLCDLGLIGVPRELLRSFRANPANLSSRELATLRNHPIYSQTLAALIDPRPEVAEVIRAHHEHFDGSGYPEGISGRNIPWPARCLAVATAFAESNLPKQATLDLLLEKSGTSFDPEAVRLFLKVTKLVSLPRQVREITLQELAPGMVLASGIYSPHGLLLIGEDQSLAASTIAKIHLHNEITPINQRLLVYT